MQSLQYHDKERKMAKKDARMIQYDTMAKKRLSLPPILAFILKHCTEEFRDIPLDVIQKRCLGETTVGTEKNRGEPLVRTLPTEDKHSDEMSVLYDIKAIAHVPDENEDIQIIVNIEAQKDNPRGYPLLKRAIYYCSRLIASQMKKGSKRVDYRRIRKVYSIWVLMNSSRRSSNSKVMYHMTEDREYGDFRAGKETYDLITVVVLALGEEYTAGNEVLRMLDKVFRSGKPDMEVAAELKDEYGLDIGEYVSEEEGDMCNLSQGFVDMGRREGRKEGRALGHAEGRAEGEQRMGMLMSKLLSLGKTEEALRASSDSEYRNQLYKQYNL